MVDEDGSWDEIVELVQLKEIDVDISTRTARPQLGL